MKREFKCHLCGEVFTTNEPPVKHCEESDQKEVSLCDDCAELAEELIKNNEL